MFKKKKEVDIDEVAQHTLLQYVQHWGQSVEERIRALNEAIAVAGIKATFIQSDEEVCWKCKNKKHGERAKNLRNAIDNIERGEFYDEVMQIAEAIRAA